MNKLIRWLIWLIWLVPFSSAIAKPSKPKIAILGLEVVEDTGSKSTQRALQISQALRVAAQAPSSPFKLAPNSAKDLLELKLLSDCASESEECMSAIAKQLKAEFLMYGKIERLSTRYRVELALLNARTKRIERSVVKRISAKNIEGSAQSLFDEMTQDKSYGTLKIKTNASLGSVVIDGIRHLTLKKGNVTVDELTTGVHQVVITAAGFRSYEASVVVEKNETNSLDLTLQSVEQDPKSSQSSPSKKSSKAGWKAAFVGGAIVTGALGSGWGYYGVRSRTTLKDQRNDRLVDLQTADQAHSDEYVMGDIATFSDDVLVHVLDQDGQSVGQIRRDECNDNYGSVECRVANIADACKAAKTFQQMGATQDSSVNNALSQYIQSCDEGQKASRNATIFAGATIGAALFTAYFAYRGWLKDDESSQTNTVRFEPHVGPNHVGAGLSVDF